MPDGLYNDVVDELRICGFEYWKAAKGSHEKWKNESGQVLIVPRNLKSRHTANGILKDAGSNKKL